MDAIIVGSYSSFEYNVERNKYMMKCYQQDAYTETKLWSYLSIYKLGFYAA